MISVGIDVAKRSHEACFMDAEGKEIGRPLRFPNTAGGVATLSDHLRRLGQPVSIALEATGHYWLALHERLAQEGFSVQVVNPIQTDAYRRTTVRKVKSDRRDSWIIADFHRIGRVRPGYVPDVTVLPLRELTRFRFRLVDQVGDAKRKALTILDRVFPEYEGLFSDVFIATSRQLLPTATTAEESASFDLEELAALLRRSSRGRFGREKAQAIQMAARNSLGLSSLGPVAALELRCLLDQIEFLEAQIAQVEAAIEELMAQEEQYLTTIKGLGAVLAATILAEIGDIGRFSRLESLVAYAGIDPAVYSSGQFRGTQAKLSKRGSPYLRRALWPAATSARHPGPELQEYYERKRRAGKPYGIVMSAVCRKLLARIYVILKENRPYEVRQPLTLHSRSFPQGFSHPNCRAGGPRPYNITSCPSAASGCSCCCDKPGSCGARWSVGPSELMTEGQDWTIDPSGPAGLYPSSPAHILRAGRLGPSGPCALRASRDGPAH